MSTNGPPQRLEKPWKAVWLEAYRECGTIKGACERADISRRSVNRERQLDEEFALQVHEIEQETTEALEKTAVQIALEGNVTMLIFMLKCRKPEVYTERHHLEHSGSVSLLDLERALDEAPAGH